MRVIEADPGLYRRSWHKSCCILGTDLTYHLPAVPNIIISNCECLIIRGPNIGPICRALIIRTLTTRTRTCRTSIAHGSLRQPSHELQALFACSLQQKRPAQRVRWLVGSFPVLWQYAALMMPWGRGSSNPEG